MRRPTPGNWPRKVHWLWSAVALQDAAMAASRQEEDAFNAAREVAREMQLDELKEELAQWVSSMKADAREREARLIAAEKNAAVQQTLKEVADEKCEEAVALLGAEVRARRKSRERRKKTEKDLRSELEATRQELAALRRDAPAQPAPERTLVV